MTDNTIKIKGFNKTRYGFTHTHCEDSRFDSAVNIDAIFARAKEMGAKAVAITDHGVLTAVESAKAASKKYGVKYIPGVEAYYKDITAPDEVDKRMHLILLAKDIIGYNAITLAVTKSNANMDSSGFPRMTDEVLSECFGPNSKGHGHVIATSACMGGIIASVLLMNNAVQEQIDKLLQKKALLNNPNSPIYISACKKLEQIAEELKVISETLPNLTKLAKTPFTKKEKTLKTFEGTPEYSQKKAELDEEKARCAEATKEIESLKSRRTELKLEERRLSEGIKPVQKDIEKHVIYDQKIASLKKNLFSDDAVYAKAVSQTKKFVALFGEGNFYCEVQNHGIKEEAYVMPIIAKIAEELNIPVIAADDAHMISNSPNEIKARQLIRSLRFNKWEEFDDADAEMYMKSDEELAIALDKILPHQTVVQAIENIKTVVDSCNVEFKSEPHYPKFRSEKSNNEDAITRLRRLAREGIAWRYPNHGEWTSEHEKRLEYELDIITKLGFCDYLCIVEDFLRYGRLLGKIDLNDPRYLADPYNMDLLEELAQDQVGLGIGPGRGSAVGSIVAYLVGITGVDPMKYGLIFERFLNVERVSMPDIDSDFKTDIRDKVLDYVKHVYGEEAVCCIMTRGTQAAKASIRNAARILGSEKYDDTAHFLSLGDAIAKKVPEKIGIKLDDCMEELTNQFGNNPDAMECINNAKLIEGTFINVGMHAAGVIIADNGDVKQYVPLMWNKDKEQWMTQCEKGPCEANGLLKMDVRLVR
jgi:DNA polymerase-3 subunit alpha